MQSNDPNHVILTNTLPSRDQRGLAFGVLAEQFEYDNCEYWNHKSWRPPGSVDRGPQPDPGHTWPLDINDVPFIGPEDCIRLATGTPHYPKIQHALGLITKPPSYSKLRDPSKDPSVTYPRESKDLSRFKDELLAKRYISPITRQRVSHFVTAFKVPKPKKKTLRSVLDGRPQNAEQFRPPPAQLASMGDIGGAVQKYAMCQELDGISYFNQFKMHPEIAADWVIKLGKERFTWNRMPMGWSYAVYVSHTVTELLADIKHSRGEILCYIDNIYVFGHDSEAVTELTDAFLARCAAVNASFEVTTPTTTSLVILGILCDTKAKTFALPTSFLEKFEKVLVVLDDCFAQGSQDNRRLPTTELLWKVFGALMWGTRVLDVHLCKFGIFMNWLSRRASQLAAMPDLWTSPCAIWPSALAELRKLIKVVLENKPRSVLASQHNGEYDHVLFTDASDAGLGIVHCSSQLQRTTSKAWSHTMRKTIIAERELYALVEGVRETITALGPVKKILAYNDNTNVIAWVKRRRGKSALSNRLLIELERILGSTVLDVEYVPSHLNCADRPSRLLPSRM